MTHLKRLGVPKTWPIPRKGLKFAVTPSPGPHPKRDCMPLRIILRDLLGYADTSREAMSILSQGKILVDKKPRKSPKFPVGLMDVMEIPDTKQVFRMITTKRGLGLEKISDAESAWKFCKIIGKTTLKGGIQQLNLHDGYNILSKKDAHKVGDTLMISIPDKRVLKHLKLEKGSRCVVTAGRNIGSWGTIKEIETKDHMLEKSTVTLDTGKREIKTLKEYIFIADLEAKAPAAAKTISAKKPAPAKKLDKKPASAKKTKKKPSIKGKHPEGHTQKGTGKGAK